MTIAKAPAGWLWNHSYDLHLLNVLRAEGVPAESVRHGHVTVATGTLTHTVDGETAVFEWKPEGEEALVGSEENSEAHGE